jgi:hypothetical protein
VPSIVAIVSWPGDSVATSLAAALSALGRPLVHLGAESLAGRATSLRGDRFEVDGRRVAAIFWRISPFLPLSSEFRQEDRSFADSETAATWLAAMQLPSIFTVNRFIARHWYGGATWQVWRRCLEERGVSVSPMSHGCTQPTDGRIWKPYLSADCFSLPPASYSRVAGIATTCRVSRRPVVNLLGGIVESAPSATQRSAAASLNAAGIGLSTIATDEDDRVSAIDVFPTIANPFLLEAVTARLGKAFDEHLLDR